MGAIQEDEQDVKHRSNTEASTKDVSLSHYTDKGVTTQEEEDDFEEGEGDPPPFSVTPTPTPSPQFSALASPARSLRQNDNTARHNSNNSTSVNYESAPKFLSLDALELEEDVKSTKETDEKKDNHSARSRQHSPKSSISQSGVEQTEKAPKSTAEERERRREARRLKRSIYKEGSKSRNNSRSPVRQRKQKQATD